MHAHVPQCVQFLRRRSEQHRSRAGGHVVFCAAAGSNRQTCSRSQSPARSSADGSAPSVPMSAAQPLLGGAGTAGGPALGSAPPAREGERAVGCDAVQRVIFLGVFNAQGAEGEACDGEETKGEQDGTSHQGRWALEG